MSRPRGSFGDVALALRGAARLGPATVRELAERACVGYDAARYTASRLVDRGELVVLDGQVRPVVLASPHPSPHPSPQEATERDSMSMALDRLQHAWWSSPAFTGETLTQTVRERAPSAGHAAQKGECMRA